MTTDTTATPSTSSGSRDQHRHAPTPTDPGAREVMKPPALDACTSCPYRRDVPSGIWSEQDYAKLARYDRETSEQPRALFACHQNDSDSAQSRMCAGWAACHAHRARTILGVDLLALRLAMALGTISSATYRAATDHHTRSELFESGTAAAEHGRAELAQPGPEARIMIAKVTRRRTDLR